MEKTQNALDIIHQEWLAAGKKEPSSAEAKRIGALTLQAYARLAELEQQLAAAKEDCYKAASALARAYGKRSFTFKGLGTCILSCRGPKVFLKFENDSPAERVNF